MTAVNPAIIPMIIVPMTFLFVLLIILVSKSPKAGAWLIGGLVLVVPVLLLQVLRMGADFGVAVLPVIVVSVTFLFVLLIVLTAKAPKAGAVLIVALVIIMLGVFSMFVGTHRVSQQPAIAHQWLPSAPRVPVPPVPQPVIPPPPVVPAPIWSSGVDQELEADIYPSEFAAARAASAKLGKAIQELAADANALPRVVVFQEAHPYRLIAELRDAIRRALPQVSCDIESESRSARAEELLVTLYLQEVDARPAPWVQLTAGGSGRSVQVQVGEPSATHLTSGQLDINLSGRRGKQHIPIRFAQKPWMEDFATFASVRPEQAFIVARSLGTCTSEAEANQQALDDARARLTEAIGQRGDSRLGPAVPPITATDVLQGGFIVDRFAQSLEGSVAKIWRQALLLDVSGPKLAKLAHQKAGEFRQVRQSWARMGLSAVGVMVLIGVIYFFLNMATMGYYEWSLRIACVVLALVGVLSILMVVK